MPTIRSRSVDHPVAKWLFQGADLAPHQTLVLEYDSTELARKAARALRAFRDKGAVAAPGTYDPSAVDPKGEGRGLFDHIEIRLRGTGVELGLRSSGFPQPASAKVVGC